MNSSVTIECPECKGSGLDESDTPVVQVISMDASGTTIETPCFMCFGHGYIIARDETNRSASSSTEESASDEETK